MKKITMTALGYAMMPPLSVWTGYALGSGRYLLAIPLVTVCMVLQFTLTQLWIKAQTEEIKGS